jgi:hypothetical protein
MTDGDNADVHNAFLAKQLPEIWFVNEGCKNEEILNGESDDNAVPGPEKIELPEEAVETLDEYWRSSLNFVLSAEVEGIPDGRVYEDQSKKLYRAAAQAANKLQTIEVDINGVRRKISFSEATELIQSVSSSAADFGQQVKKQQQSNL